MNNKRLITRAGALATVVTLAACAAPETQMASAQKCPPDPLVLSLDHGPRAQSTPYVNQQRKERYEAQVRACAGTNR